MSAIWEGSATLELYGAPNEEHAALAPVRMGRGFRFTFALHGRRPGDGGASCERHGRSRSRDGRRRRGLDRHFIGGERLASRATLRRTCSPIDGRVLAEVSAGRRRGGRRRRARRRTPRSRPGPRSGRTGRRPHLHRLADLIDANVDRLAAVECADMAMLLALAARARDPARGAQLPLLRRPRRRLRGARLALERDLRTGCMRMPAGPAVVITPWNAPFMLSTWKTAPALAAGCTVVLKPAEWSPLSCSLLADLTRRGRVSARRLQRRPGNRRGGRRGARRRTRSCGA